MDNTEIEWERPKASTPKKKKVYTPEEVKELKQWGKDYQANVYPQDQVEAKQVLQAEIENDPTNTVLKREHELWFKEPAPESISWERPEVDWERPTQKPKSEYSRADAFGSSLAEAGMSVGLTGTKLLNKLGIISDARQAELEENYRSVFNTPQVEEARAKHPILSAGGTLGGTLVGAGIGGGVAKGLTQMAPKALGNATVGMGAMTLPALGSYSATEQRALAAGADPDLAKVGGAVDAGAQMLGGLIPGGVGTPLSARIASGIGLNVAQGIGSRAAQNKIFEDTPKLKQEVFGGLPMAMDAALGGFAGAMTTPKGGVPDTLPELPPNIGRNLLESNLNVKYVARDEVDARLNELTELSLKQQLDSELTYEKTMLEDARRKINDDIVNTEKLLIGPVNYAKKISIDKGKITQLIQDEEDVARFSGRQQSIPDLPMSKVGDGGLDRLRQKMSGHAFQSRYSMDTPQNFRNIPDIQNFLNSLGNDYDRKLWATRQIEVLEEQANQLRNTLEDQAAQKELNPAHPPQDWEVGKWQENPLERAARTTDQLLEWLKSQNFVPSMPNKGRIPTEVLPLLNTYNQIKASKVSPEGKKAAARDFVQGYAIYLADKRTQAGIVLDLDTPKPHFKRLTDHLQNLLGIGKGHALTISNMPEIPWDIRREIFDNAGFVGTHYEARPGKSIVFIDEDYALQKLREYPAINKAFEDMRKDTLNRFGEDSIKAREFLDSFIIAHELGHHFLNRLMMSLQGKEMNLKIWRNKTEGLFKEYQKYIQTTNPQKYLEDTFMLPNYKQDWQNPQQYFDRYGNFHEWFAQTFAQKILLGEKSIAVKAAPSTKTPMGLMATARNGLLSIFQTLASTLKRLDPGLKLGPPKLMEDFINKYVAENESHLQAFGRHLIEKNFEREVNNWTDWNKLTEFINVVQKGKEDPQFMTMARPPSHDDILMDVEGVKYEVLQGVQDRTWRDTNGTSLKILANAFGDGQLKTILYDNPILNYVYKVTKEAEWNAKGSLNKLWKGDISFDTWKSKSILPQLKRLVDPNSPEAVVKKLSDNDLNKLWDIFIENFGKPYEDTIARVGSSMTPMQRKGWDVLTKLFRGMYDETIATQDRLGKKNMLPWRDGWYANIRPGKFYITLHSPTDGSVVYRQHFRTEEQAALFLKRWDAVGSQHKMGIFASRPQEVKAKGTEADNSYGMALANAIRDELTNKFPEIKEFDNIAQNIMDRFILRGGKLGKHHVYRTNVPGYLGSELFTSPKERANLIRRAIQSETQEYVHRMRQMEIEARTGPLLENVDPEIKDAAKNTLAAAELMRDMALNRVPSSIEGFDNFVRDTLDKVVAKSASVFGKDFYPKTPVWDRITGATGHLFYMISLVSRPAFWVSQILTAPSSVRHIFREDNIFSGLASASMGTMRMMHPDQDFLKAVYHVAQNYDTFHPQFINDLTRLPLVEMNPDSLVTKLIEFGTGERMATAADSFSRYWTFAMMYEHYRKKGMSGTELYNKAADATDNTMILYSRGHKAPIFTKAGIPGELASPLQTFAQAQIGNLVADFRLAIKDPSIAHTMPLISTFLITALMGGAIGVPLLAEYEAIRMLMVAYNPDLDNLLPDPISFLLHKDNTLLSHGIMGAATGMDLGSGLRTNPIAAGIIQGREGVMSLFPTVQFAGDMATSFKDVWKAGLGGNVTSAERRKAAMTLTPGGYKGLVDDLMFDAEKRTMIPDNNRYFGTVPQTDKDRVASYLGTKTVDTHRQNMINYRENTKEAIRAKGIERATQLIYDALDTNNAEQLSDALDRYVALEGNPETISKKLETIVRGRNMTAEQRKILNRKGQIKSFEQQRRAINRLEYE